MLWFADTFESIFQRVDAKPSTSRMRISLVLACCAACLLLSGHRAIAEERLHVMLQGGSAADLGSLVKRHGGQITHELPIIDAVGAAPERLMRDGKVAVLGLPIDEVEKVWKVGGVVALR